MKKLLLVSLVGWIGLVLADTYPLDLKKTQPECGPYLITESATRAKVMEFCRVTNSHSGRVRLFRGSETLDLTSTNLGDISCKFRRSAVNSDGGIKECWTTTPPDSESANVTILKAAASAPVNKAVASHQVQ